MLHASPVARPPGFTRIAHLADIHIQNKRRDEYAAVFANLYASLRAWCSQSSNEEKRREENGNRTLIVVAGDVFDTKTFASALNFRDVAAFLRSLSEIAPVILIGGNHDMSTKHPGSIDLLTAVLENVALTNVTYLRHSGCTFLHGIVWTVLATDSETLFSPSDRDLWLNTQPADVQAAPCICLFHEEVNTSRFCNNQEILRFRLDPTVYFQGYEAAMGGHIHLRQGGPRWAYPGSLLQQNIGESHVGHGFLVWDFDFQTPVSFVHSPSAHLEDLQSPPLKPRFAIPVRYGVDVPNDRGFARLVFRQGKDVTPFKDRIPKEPYYYEVLHDEASRVEFAALLVEYLFRIPPRDVRLLPRRPPKKKANGDQSAANDGGAHTSLLLSEATEEAEDVSVLMTTTAADQQEEQRAFDSLTHHFELIRSCLGSTHKCLPAVLKLHETMYLKSTTMNQSLTRAKGGRVRLKKFSFSNLFCFGGHDGNDAAKDSPNDLTQAFNVIDFDPLERKVSGIIAANHSGKSSVVHALMFALYDVLPNRIGKKEVLRKGAKSWWLRLEFELDGKHGVITKSCGIQAPLTGSTPTTSPLESAAGSSKSTSKSAKVVGSSKSAKVVGFGVNRHSECFFEFDGENLTQGTLSQTLQEIQNVLGRHADASLSSFALQGDKNPDFIDMKAVDRRQTVAHFLDLGSFKLLAKEVNSRKNEAKATLQVQKGALARLTQQHQPHQLSLLKSTIQELDKKRQQLEQQMVQEQAHLPAAHEAVGVYKQLVHENTLALQTLRQTLITLKHQTPTNLFSFSLPQFPPRPLHVDQLRQLLVSELNAWSGLAELYPSLDQSDSDGSSDGQSDEYVSLSQLRERFHTAFDLDAIAKAKEERNDRAEKNRQLRKEQEELEQEAEACRVQGEQDTEQWNSRLRDAEHCYETGVQIEMRRLETLLSEATSAHHAQVTVFQQHLNHGLSTCRSAMIAESEETEVVEKAVVEKAAADEDGKDQKWVDSCLSKEAESFLSEEAELGNLLSETVATKCQELKSSVSEDLVCLSLQRAPVFVQKLKEMYAQPLPSEHTNNARCVRCEQVQGWLGEKTTETKVQEVNRKLGKVESFLRSLWTKKGKSLQKALGENVHRLKEESETLRAEKKAALTAEREKHQQWEKKRLAAESERRRKILFVKSQQSEHDDQVEPNAITRKEQAHLTASVAKGIQKLRKLLDLVEHKLAPAVLLIEQQTQSLQEKRESVNVAEQLEKRLAEWKKEGEQVFVSLQRAKDECLLLEMQIKQAESLSLEIEALTQSWRELETYALVLKDEGGIGDQLVRQSLTALAADANHILAQMNTRFKVKVDAQCELRVLNDDQMESIEVTLASGFQRFALKMAFRLVLWRIARIPVPDCFVTDEGFGSCDDDSLDGVAQLFETLATQADWPRLVLAITHLPEMKNRIEHALSITVTENGSYISNVKDMSNVERGVSGPVQGQEGNRPTLRVKQRRECPLWTASPQQEEKDQQTSPDLVAHPDKIGWFWCQLCKKPLKFADRHLASGAHLKKKEQVGQKSRTRKRQKFDTFAKEEKLDNDSPELIIPKKHSPDNDAQTPSKGNTPPVTGLSVLLQRQSTSQLNSKANFLRCKAPTLSLPTVSLSKTSPPLPIPDLAKPRATTPVLLRAPTPVLPMNPVLKFSALIQDPRFAKVWSGGTSSTNRVD